MSRVVQNGLLVPRPVRGRSRRGRAVNGLVGWWTMDSQDVVLNAGTIDRSGSGNSLSWAGNPGLIGGRVGQAVLLNGSSQFLVASAASSLQPAAVTVCAWVNPNVGADNQAILCYNKTNGASYLLAVGQINAGNFEIASFNFGAWASAFTPSITGRWSFVAGTIDGSTSMTIYVNGISKATAAGPVGGIDYTGPFSPALTVGSYQVSTGSWAADFAGALDDVRIYNRVLSAAEILTLYNRPTMDYVYDTDRIMLLAGAAAGSPAWAARVMVQV